MRNSEPEKARKKAHVVNIVQLGQLGMVDADALSDLRDDMLTMLSEEATRDEMKDLCEQLRIGRTHGDSIQELREKFKQWMYDHDLIEENVFIKQFLKTVRSKSGGVLYVVCPHHVFYYMKMLMRAEGRRDYLDFLVSVKQVPPRVHIRFYHRP